MDRPWKSSQTVLAFFAAWLALSHASPALAKGLGKVELIDWGVGVEAGFPVTNILGVGPHLTLFDTLTISAHFDIAKWVLGLMALQNVWTYGASARLRVPTIKTTPTVGIGWTTTLVQPAVSGALSSLLSSLIPGTQRYVSVMVGLEHRFTNKIAAGVEVGIPYLLDSSGNWNRVTPAFPIGFFAQIAFGD